MVGDGEGHVGDGTLRDVDAVDQLLGVHVDWVQGEALHDFLLILVQSSLKNQLSFLSSFPPKQCLSCLFLVETLSALIEYTGDQHT